MQLSLENQRWLDAFRAKHGRAPRILHIGNIANNAYNNAKLLNEAGLDCDVICYDYYHIMGCPEWEDADFAGDYGDQFRPDWVAAGVKNFTRPRWFAQGPVEDCIEYLIAKRKGRTAEAERLWRKLAVVNKTAPTPGQGETGKIFTCRVRIQQYLSRIGRALWFVATGKGIASRIAGSCDAGRISSFFSSEVVRLLAAWSLLGVALVVRLGGYPFRVLIRQDAKAHLQAKAMELIDTYAREFKDRQDQLHTTDIQPYQCRLGQWRQLLACYDHVIGYSTDPILPLVAGIPYFAFEHGTIRKIPYYATSEGRLTALAYRLAQHVFVTNFDCVESAEHLAPCRFTIINHPYDEDHGLKVTDWEQIRKEMLSELDCEFLFFHPTRHDWVEGSGYADKSNDVFLRAFVSLRNEGARVGLVCCFWGANVKESKALLEEHGCSSHVRWVAPLAITPFERMCLAADLVVDQFKLGAFGGVVFKAMAVGRPILTYLDEKRLLKQYSVCPPVVNCRTKDEIISRLQTLLNNPDKLKILGESSRAWIKKFHSKEETVNAQVGQIRSFAPIHEAIWVRNK
jgi:glycosyltransferase involved in cell wall biosynthesis